MGAYKNVEVGVAIPYVYIDDAKNKLGKVMHLCAQDCSRFKGGPYTGEVSANMLKESGFRYAMVGHSERRSFLNELDSAVLEKIEACIEASLDIILCVGETLEERRNNKTIEKISMQLSILDEVKGLKRINVAYEPIWAIGTGKSAEVEDIKIVFSHINAILTRLKLEFRILYGGSVKKTNCINISKIGGLNGFLVGNSSLNDEFFSIIDSLDK